MNLLKYPGGKESELNIIQNNLPLTINNFYDPFVGGGSVYFGINASNHYYINDKSAELINLYKCVKNQNTDFYKTILDIEHNWTLLSKISREHREWFINIYYQYRDKKITDIELSDKIEEFILQHTIEFNGMLQTSFNFYLDKFISALNKSILSKIKRMSVIEGKRGVSLLDKDILKNIEGALKGAFYNHFRYIYNNLSSLNKSSGFDAAVFLFIREMCYSSMFRYNNNGQFNVPYGGISYNNKSFQGRINDYTCANTIDRFNKTTIACMDFYDFMEEYSPLQDDFVFIDPPYDTTFNTYSKNTFGSSDQERLAEYLINKCNANFMIIIKKTDLISSLYPNGKKCKNGNILNVNTFAKKYAVNFKNRNEQNVEHLIITNYKE